MIRIVFFDNPQSVILVGNTAIGIMTSLLSCLKFAVIVKGLYNSRFENRKKIKTMKKITSIIAMAMSMTATDTANAQYHQKAEQNP